jgi:hypothetical protein
MISKKNTASKDSMRRARGLEHKYFSYPQNRGMEKEIPDQ